MIIVSIICPVYKTEDYIRRCVDSIIHQTYTDWELILVDDGSPDSCGKICDEYAKNDIRIKVVHQPNQGLAVARQVGFDESKGEYVLFVDSDDWIDKHMLEYLIDSAIKENSDIVYCDNYNVYKHHLKYMTKKPSSFDERGLIKDLVCHGNGNLWNKLFKRTCFLYPSKSQWVPGVNVFEDLLISCKVLMSPRKVSYVNKPLYYYNQYNVNSYMHNSHLYEKRVVINNLLKDVFKGKYPFEMNYLQANLAYSALVENKLDKDTWLHKFSHIDISNLEGINIGLKIALYYNYYCGKICSQAIMLIKFFLKRILFL